MNIAMNEDFRIAYERSDEVLANINIPRDGLVDVNEVLNYIKSSYFPELIVYSRSFAGIGSPAGPCDTCGAMARLSFKDGEHNAVIVLNSDLTSAFQRFALIQQVGHLMTLPYPEDPLRPYGECPRMSCLPVDDPYCQKTTKTRSFCAIL